MENSNSKDTVMDELKNITTTTYDVSNGVFNHKITSKRLKIVEDNLTVPRGEVYS